MMLKHLFYILLLSFGLNQAFSQVLYSERFNTQTLLDTGYTNTNSKYFYKDVPSNMVAIDVDTLRAEITNGNYPFKASGQLQKGWLSYVPSNNLTDTFAVSTSWLNPIGTANAWLITPIISNIAFNSVLTWEAMAPDLLNPDGYEIYVSTSNSPTPSVSDFSTLLFSQITENNSWQTRGVSLSAFAGQNIRIAFINNSTDKYQLWLDDIKVENITNGFDAGTVSHSIYKYSTINTNNTISAIFKNNGFTPISNLTINYKMDNGPIISEVRICSPAMNYLETRYIDFLTLYNSSVPIYHNFKIWTSDINLQPDQVHVNDTITGSITISDSIPAKNILVEEFTSAACGWCPNSFTNLKTIVSATTNVIATSIHNNDSLTINASNYLYSTQGGSSDVSLGMVDRYMFSGSSKLATNDGSWATNINQRQTMIVPVSVSVTAVTYDTLTRQISATVSAHFVGDVKGIHGINLYIKENNVYGPIADSSDNKWNQHNNSYNIPSSPYYQYGNLISGNYVMSAVSYKHQYVIDEFMDGWKGDTTKIPSNGSTKGQTYSKTYTYTLPNSIGNKFRYNANNIYLIGLVSAYDSNYYNSMVILNSAEVKLNSKPESLVGVKEYANTNIQLNIFPNPTSDICHLNFSLKDNEYVKINVYNTLGELVYIETKSLSAGNVDYTLNLHELHSGNYSVQISFGNAIVTKKLTIIK